MVSLSSINSEPLHKHQPWNSQCSEPGDIIFRQQWGLDLPKTPIGGQISGGSSFFAESWACLGLAILWTHGTVLCDYRWLHYISALEEEAAAGEACPALGGSDESFHLHIQPTFQRRHGINAALNIGPSPAVTNTEMKVQIPGCLWERDTSEGRGYGRRGSNPRAETPVAMEAALVVSRQPVSN
ncbi:Testis-expressed sequence 38 protein [Sciurus carolinensis]|uniref:Testis-expressed sequence 38 protein n=1 Tax=Sciurus carolinensis TaxID=30640 RepID=A0AA41TC16_SCICA|nr:Testis-expressed sequence 38 protein [Sciurus carolinensis]